MSQQPLGVAVVGAGKMGADHVRRLRSAVSDVRVRAVADVDVHRAAAVAGGGAPGSTTALGTDEGTADCAVTTDPLQALDAPGVQAVLIASPGPAHEEVLLAALARGLPVLCEKPLTPDPKSALRVVEAELRGGRRLIQVGFMRRFDPEYLRLRELLDQGALGRPLLMHCRHRNVRPHDYFTEAMMISDSVVHEMDCARWLLGQEISAVTVVKPTPSSHAPNGISDPQIVLLETSSGVLVTVEVFVSCGFGYQVQAEVVCERGTASLGFDQGVHTSTAGGLALEIDQDFLDRFGQAYERELRSWVQAARRGGAAVGGPTAWDGYAAAAACEAGVRAQHDGVRTPVTLVDRPSFYA